MTVKSLFAVFIVLVLVGCSCRSYEAKRKTETAVEEAVNKFHEQLNQEQYQAIYAESDAVLKNNSTESEFTAQLRDAHEQLGTTSGKAIVIIDDRGWRGFWAAFGPKRELVSNWDSPANDLIIANENFVWAVENEQPKLVSYQFRTVCRKPCSVGITLR